MLLLGCPTRGTQRALRLATGDDELVEMLYLLSGDATRSKIGQIMRDYPGVLAALPDSAGPEVWTPDWWQDRFGVRPRADALQKAKAVRDRTTGVGFDRQLYVAGRGQLTALAFDESVGEFRGDDAGDGVVSADSAAPHKAEVYFAESGGLDLARLVPIFPAYEELLQRGTTERLSTERPAPSGAAQAVPRAAGRALFPTDSRSRGSCRRGSGRGGVWRRRRHRGARRGRPRRSPVRQTSRRRRPLRGVHSRGRGGGAQQAALRPAEASAAS